MSGSHDDQIEQFEAKETSRKLPAAWLVVFYGLIAFGVFYVWAYTPSLGGWAQSQDAEGGTASSGSSLLATILFTAIPAAVAVALVLAQRKKK